MEHITTNCRNCEHYFKGVNPDTLAGSSSDEIIRATCQEPSEKGFEFLLNALQIGLATLGKDGVVIQGICPYFTLITLTPNEVLLALIPLLLNTQEEV